MTPSYPAPSRFGLDVSVVLPCLNEEDSVGACVELAIDAMRDAGYRGEVVVVDNGSTDRSAELAARSGARVIRQDVRGYGAALQAGIDAARGEVVVMADADLTYPLEKIAELVEPVRRGEVDLMLGSRLDAATRASMPFLHRYVGTPTLTFLVRRASGSGLRLTDSQSGFRAFRRDQMLTLGLQGTGMEFASEMIIRANGAGWRIHETATGYRERVGESKLNTFGDGWRHLRLILSLAPHLLLVGPGLVLGAVGLVLTILSLVGVNGFVTVGSVRWQPVFFTPMLLTLAACLLLSGSVIAHRSVLLHGSVRDRYAFVGGPHFARRCFAAGAASAALGIVLDIGLLVADQTSTGSAGRRFALAGVAQAAILIGLLLALFGIVASLVATNRAYERAATSGVAPAWRSGVEMASAMDGRAS